MKKEKPDLENFGFCMTILIIMYIVGGLLTTFSEPKQITEAQHIEIHNEQQSKPTTIKEEIIR